MSAVSLPLHAGTPVIAPGKGGTGVAVSAKGSAMPDNLALGLQDMATDYSAAMTKGTNSLSTSQFANVASNYPLARTDDQQRVQVEVILDGTVAMADLVTACQGAGCEITAQIDWYHQGEFSMWMPLSQAAMLAQTAGVDSIKLSLKPFHRAGKVPGQGAKVLNALTAQTTYGVLGAGVTVGAQSDSYNALGTTYPVHAAQDVASGDLPGTGNPEGYTTPVTVVKDYSGGEDEGRAMLQIIHDVAPAAALYFRTGDTSEADFASGIGILQADGCNVICDDIGYYDEPMFSDGVLAQAVDKATAAGAVYFSSAGNDGNSGYTATYNPQTNNATTQALLLSEGGITYSGITATESAAIESYHSFGTNAAGNPILVQKVLIPLENGVAGDYPGQLVFQWNDPDAVTVNGVKQVSTDYDILVFTVAANGTATYSSSKSGKGSNFSTNIPEELPTSQLVAGTQYEFVIVRTNRTANTGGPTRNIATQIRWAIETDATQVAADFVTNTSPNTYGHPASATCAGTAAYVYDDQFLASDATYTPILEAYSSNGPVMIYFDSAGNRLSTPITRKQPLLATVDGVSTTFFPPTTGTTAPGPSNPSSADSDGDGYPNFFGTSAAAPHAAGCAALIINAATANGLTVTPADIKTLMTSTTQGQNDQDPTVSNATAGNTTFSAQDRGTYSDSHAFTITYNGATGTTLNTLVFDLSTLPLGGEFITASYPVTTGAATSGTGGTAPAIASSTVTGGSTSNQTLTLTLSNFTPGSTLSFGVCQTVGVSGGQYYIHGDQLAGATITATDSTGTAASGTLANTYSKKWSPKTGFGLVDVNAAIHLLLGK